MTESEGNLASFMAGISADLQSFIRDVAVTNIHALPRSITLEQLQAVLERASNGVVGRTRQQTVDAVHARMDQIIAHGSVEPPIEPV